MKYTFFLLFLGFVLTLTAKQSITVFDADDQSPIAAATVFGKGGNIIGMTDKDGIISGFADSDMPLTVRSLGYEPLTVSEISDKIYMTPDNYELGEFIVTPQDRPILRIICYIREYNSGVTSSDTIQTFAEHMGDFYIPTAKVKKFKGNRSPRILKSILYERYASKDGTDSVASPDSRRDDISWLNLVFLPKETIKETNAIANGAKIDSVAGKYTLKTLSRKNDDMYMTKTDYLADKKGHNWSPTFFKLLGFTIDVQNMVCSWAYRANENGEYRPSDLIYGTLALDILGRGKWIKKAFKSNVPVQMHGLYEIYPVKLEHLTVEEADEQLHHSTPSTEFERSPLAAPLPPAVRSLINRVSAIK